MIRRGCRLRYRLFALAVAVAAFSADAFNGRLRAAPEHPDYRRLDDLAEKFDMTMENRGEEAVWDGRELFFAFRPDRRMLRLNGGIVYLTYPALRDAGGNWLLHRLDLATVLLPFLAPDTLPHSPVSLIILDPGHGGDDPGARSGDLLEKDLNLTIARLVAARLRAAGCKVLLTRDGDETVPLDVRPALIATANADLFLSIHQNSSTNPQAHGVETFAMTPAGAASSHEAPEKTGAPAEPGNRFDRSSLRLAHFIQTAVLSETRAFDRGVKRARFRVLRLADCPAALVECGFLSEAAEQKKLTDAAYQERIADGIANGIFQYLEAFQPETAEERP